jgi:hypothetical protein
MFACRQLIVARKQGDTSHGLYASEVWDVEIGRHLTCRTPPSLARELRPAASVAGLSFEAVIKGRITDVAVHSSPDCRLR